MNGLDVSGVAAGGRQTAARGAYFGLAVLTSVNLLNYLDRYIVAGVMPKLEAEFQLSHAQGGLLGTVFIIVYMLASPAAGVLGDRMPRRFLIAGGVFVWSLATLYSGLATSFLLLLLARAVIGIGEAGYGTVAPAVISDLFPRTRRTRMLSYFYAAIPVGAALGYVLGGWLGSAYSWQVPFFVGGAPGLILAVGTLYMREPERGAMDEPGARTTMPFLEGLRGLVRNRVFWPTTVGYTLMTFSIGGLAYWMPAFLELERRMDGQVAGVAFGGVTLVAGLVGTLAGGAAGDWADRKRPGGGLWVSGVGLCVAGPLMYLAANAGGRYAIFGLVFAAQFFLFLNSGPINAAIVNCVAPAFRAFAMGLNVLLIHLLGDAVSPPLIGSAADAWNLEAAIELNALPVILGGCALMVAAVQARRQEQPAPATAD